MSFSKELRKASGYVKEFEQEMVRLESATSLHQEKKRKITYEMCRTHPTSRSSARDFGSLLVPPTTISTVSLVLCKPC